MTASKTLGAAELEPTEEELAEARESMARFDRDNRHAYLSGALHETLRMALAGTLHPETARRTWALYRVVSE